MCRYLFFLLFAVHSFKLLAAPPTFLPTHGSAASATGRGTIVTLTGVGFSHATIVKLNGLSVGNRVTDLNGAINGFQVLDDVTLLFIVPFGATSGPVSVSFPRRVDRSISNFVVSPRVTMFSPATTSTTGIVTVTGANLSDITSILINGVSLGPRVVDVTASVSGFQVLSSTQLKFRVPRDAASGKIELVNSASDSVSTANILRVRPAILSFAPTRGSETVGAVPGEIIELSGSGFSDATVVKLNGVSVGPRVADLQSVTSGFQVLSSQRIMAIVPANATSGKITVTNSVGIAATAASFTVDPRIASVSPPFGPAGSPVVISGTNLGAVVSIVLVDVPIGNSFQVISNSKLQFNVPVGAQTGRIVVTNHAGGEAVSPNIFEVVNTLTSFSPASGQPRSAGVPGTAVTLNGVGFLAATEVLFGGVSSGNLVADLSSASTGFQIVSDTELLARVPAGARTGPITVRDFLPFSELNTLGGTLGISQDPFIVSPGICSLTLPAFFNDKMVLQRDVEIPIWGKSLPGSQVVVNFLGQEKSATTNDAGDWRVSLDPLPVTQNATLTINSGSESLSIANVAVGDVWFCSGQSNMAFPVRLSTHATELVSVVEDSDLRAFKVGTAPAVESQNNVSGEWYPVEYNNAGELSAVAYYFARELRQKLNVPVGVIVSAVNGTPAEAWTSYETLASNDVFTPFLANWQDRVIRRPSEALNSTRPGVLFNGMVAPLAPFPIKGVVWYQGESNVLRSSQYKTLLPLMIADWRRLWVSENGSAPRFYLIQLANYGQLDEYPKSSDRAELREAQQQTATQPGNSLVVTIDIGDPAKIHPANKLDVAKRVSYSVLAQTYGQAVESVGPSFSGMQSEGSSLRLSFTNATGLKTTHSVPAAIPAFAVAGADRNWLWAQVQIDGEQIILSHPSIAQPVAARYGWSSNPRATMYNSSNLPMVPFRTDNWPGVNGLAP